jgi:hypothetical protein
MAGETFSYEDAVKETPDQKSGETFSYEDALKPVGETEAEPKDETPSVAGSFAREAGRSVIPGVAGIAGGALAGAAAGFAGGPLAPITVPVAALAGGIAAGMGARKLQDSVSDEVAPDSFMGTKSAQEDAEAHPVATFGGSLVGMGKPSASALSGAVKAVGTQAGRQGIKTIAKQIGSKEARDAVKKATTETIEGTETLTPDAIKALEAQKVAGEHFGHALGGAAGVGAMTGMGIAEGEDPGTAALKGVAGLAVKPWVGPGGVFFDPFKAKGGKTTPSSKEEAPEPNAVDPGIENLADSLLSDPTTEKTGAALKEAAATKTEADVENPLKPAFTGGQPEVSSTTTRTEVPNAETKPNENQIPQTEPLAKSTPGETIEQLPTEAAGVLPGVPEGQEAQVADPLSSADAPNPQGVSAASETPVVEPTAVSKPELPPEVAQADPSTPEGRATMHIAAAIQKPENFAFHQAGILRELQEAQAARTEAAPEPIGNEGEEQSRDIRGRKAAQNKEGREVYQYVEGRPLAQLWLGQERVISKTGERLPSLYQIFAEARESGNIDALQKIYWEMIGARRPSAANETFAREVGFAYENLTGEPPKGVEEMPVPVADRPELLKNRAPFNKEEFLGSGERRPVNKPEVPVAEEEVPPTAVEPEIVNEDLENVEPPLEEAEEPQINATPKAFERANELGIDIAEVAPGKNGRISAADVQKHANKLKGQKITATPKETPKAQEAEPVEVSEPESDTPQGEPKYWYRNAESKAFFESSDSLRQQIDRESDPNEKKRLASALGELRAQYQRDPNRYFRVDLNNPIVKIYDEAGVPQGEQIASLAGAKWRDLGASRIGDLNLREVTLTDGTQTYVDLDTLPEPVRDQIDQDTPPLKKNISAIRRATGKSRNTLAKWEEEGMPTEDVDQAVAWIENREKQKQFASKTRAAAKSASSLNTTLGDGTATIGDTYVGTDPNKPSVEADNSTAALVNRAIAHMERADVPIERRLAVGRMLQRGEIVDELGMADEDYRRISAAVDKIENELRPTEKVVDINRELGDGEELREDPARLVESAEGKLIELETLEGEITPEKVKELADWMEGKEILTESEFEEITKAAKKTDRKKKFVTSPEELLELLKTKFDLAKERLALAQEAWKNSKAEETEPTETKNSPSALEEINEKVDALVYGEYTPDQLMDNVDGQGDFEVSPLRAIDAGSQGETQQRGEVIRETHAEDALQQIAADPRNDSMVNLVAQHLLDRFAKSGRLLRTPVDIHNRLESGVLGEYDPATGRIALEENSAAETILEEVLHSLTADRNLPREIHDLFKKIQKEAVKKGLTSKEQWTRAADPTVLNKGEGDAFHYAFSNPHELLAAALKNRDVRDALNDLEVRDSITGKLVSAWKYLKGELIKWLGFNVKKDSALDQYLNKMFDHMSEGDLENNTFDSEGGSGVLYAHGNESKEPSEEARRISERLAQRRAGNQKADAEGGGSTLQNVLRVTERVPGRDSQAANRGWAEAGLESLRSLEDWAEKNGKVIPSERILSELRSNRALDEGSEHTVVKTADGKRVIKVTHDDALGTGVVGQSAHVNDYLKGLEYQNILFGGKNPENHYTFDGLVYLPGSEGRPQLVVSQPYVGGKKATEAQITRFFKDRGFVKKDGYWIGTQDGYTYTVGDAVPDNVKAFRNSDGELIIQPIDVQVSRKPIAETGKLRAISTNPQKAKTTRSLEQALLTADPEVRARMANKTYMPETYKGWEDSANDWITSRVQAGDSHLDIVNKLMSGGAVPGLASEQEVTTAKYIAAEQAKVLKWAVQKEAKAAGITTSVDQALMDQYTQTGNQLIRDLSERGTMAGKILSVFRMIARNLNKNYVIDEYVSPLFKAQQEKLAGKKEVKEMRAAIETAIKESGETTVDRAKNVIRRIFKKPTESADGAVQAAFDFFDEVKLPDNTSPSKISIPISEQYANAASKALTKHVAGSISSKLGRADGPSLRMIQDVVRKSISARMREIFKDVEETPDYDRNEAVRQMAMELDLADLSEKAFNQSVQDILAQGDEAKITPAQRAVLETAQYDGGSMRSAQDILRREVNFRDVVKETLTSRTASRESLIGDIVENSGISRDQAERVADALRQTYEFEAQKSAKSQLETLVKNKDARDARAKVKQVKEPDINKLMKLTNMGAFSEERFYNAIADSYNLPTWDPVFAKQLEKEAEQVQNLPEGQFKDQRTGDILNKIATKYTENALNNWRTKEGISKILDLTTSAWQAGVLSGPPTQVVNLLGSHFSVLTESLFEGLGYAIKAKDMRYLSDALGSIYSSIAGKEARQEISRALSEGTTQYRVNKMEGASQLENLDPSNLKGLAKGLAGYASKLKYVGRAMLALDAVNMVSADMAKQKMATRFFLENASGKSKAEVQKTLNDLFYPDQKVMDGVRATAEKEAAEGMYGDDKAAQKKWIDRRISELLQKRREEVYNGVTEQGTSFAEHATYNDQATGLLGRFVAGVASQLNAEVKVTKFFLSFMNTLSNIMNQSLDYTLWGSLRAANMSPSQLRFAENSKYAPRKFQEGSPEQAAQYAKSILGTTAFISLAYMAWKGLQEEAEGKVPFFSIHGNGPSNSMDKQQLLATQNWQPNSIRVGNKWFRYVDWPVLGVALGGIGAAYDAVRYKKDEQTTSELFQAAAMASVSTVLQKNMLQGVTTFIDALNGQNAAVQKTAMSRLTSGVVAGYTNPGLLRWARNTFGMGKDGQVARLDQGTTEGWLMSMVPASIGYNTPALNTLGEPISQPWYSATTWRFTNANNIPPHPIITPLVKAGLMLPNPSKNTEFRFLAADGSIMKGRLGKYPEAYRRFVQLRGEYMKEALSPSTIDQLAEAAKENKNSAQDYLDSKIGNAARAYAVKILEMELADNKLALR